MNIENIIAITEKPNLYEKGSSVMWADPHISKQLLQAHLDPNIDVASRKKQTIERTANWILENCAKNEQLRILDLGCGPGLYTEIFAKAGHKVTGIDISRNSIDYAVKSAKKKGLNIDYQNSSYLDADLGQENYDVIVLIYTDLGVLLPIERQQLLVNIFRALKHDGVFIFDVLKDDGFETKLSPKTWETSKGGFWKATPYLALSESFLYEKEKVLLFQHTIIDAINTIDVYRFWTHFFSEDDIVKMLKHQHFKNIVLQNNLLPDSDMWNGKNVIFAKCEK